VNAFLSTKIRKNSIWSLYFQNCQPAEGPAAQAAVAAGVRPEPSLSKGSIEKCSPARDEQESGIFLPDSLLRENLSMPGKFFRARAGNLLKSGILLIESELDNRG